MNSVARLATTKRPFLTDAGMETWLFFQQGFEAPEFAAITLMNDPEARAAMRRYFDGFLEMAETAQTGFVLDTNTWRGCLSWAPKLGLDKASLARLNADAVRFAKSIKANWSERVPDIVINGVIGPAGDAYAPGATPGADVAEANHLPQIHIFDEEGVDMVSAITMTNVPEAIGIVRAARLVGLPIVISFTVEVDGTLPTGETLQAAIRAVDEATDAAPLYYMINCAHPEHFAALLEKDEPWISRLGGVRANASRLSHQELDNAEELDDGDPDEFGELHADLARHIPKLRVIGGCCGTDHRHVRCVSEKLHAAA